MPLHYRPADGFVGDVIPFFWRGDYHLFYLKAPLPPAREGAGGVPWAHIVSSNLRQWEELPDAIAPGREGEPDAGGCWTGSVVHSGNLFHIFYTGYAPGRRQRPQTVCHAVSRDLKSWEKDQRNPVLSSDDRWYERTDWRDPFVFWNGDERCYWMLVTARVKDAPTSRAGCIALAKSDDLENWEVQPPLWTPYVVHVPECPDVFQLGERWHMIFSTRETRYRVAGSPAGPWGAPAVESLDGRWLYAAKTLSDGQRRLLFGWVATREGERDSGAWEWGGDLALPRQLEPAEDGGLLVRCPEEVVSDLGSPLLNADEIGAFKPRLGRWMTDDERLTGEAQDGFGYAICPEVRSDFALRMELSLAGPPSRAGLLLRAGEGLERAYVLMVEPLLQRITLRPWQSWGDAEPFVERPLRMPRGEPISLQLALEGTILEVLVNHRCCLTCRLYDHRQGHLGLFVENGLAEFSGLTVWSLADS